jgi:hypothetical protein
MLLLLLLLLLLLSCLVCVLLCRCHASRICKMFVTRQIAYSSRDYSSRLRHFYRKITMEAAAASDWDAAIYWLQQLINNEVSSSSSSSSSRDYTYQ